MGAESTVPPDLTWSAPPTQQLVKWTPTKNAQPTLMVLKGNKTFSLTIVRLWGAMGVMSVHVCRHPNAHEERLFVGRVVFQ